jgi:hypothetical protein
MDCGSLDDVYKLVGKIPEDVLSEMTYQVHIIRMFTYVLDFTRSQVFTGSKDYSS